MWALVNEVFPEANVTSYGKHLPGLTNHVKDRHVVAAALEAGVTVIVTDDMGDFVPLPEGLRAMSADTFLLELFNRAPDQMFDVLLTGGRLQASPNHIRGAPEQSGAPACPTFRSSCPQTSGRG